MAASLESLDQIRDTLIARGIGNSGLTSQAIQRANLPDLSTSLATASSIRASEQKKRESELKQKQLSSVATALRASASNAFNDGASPTIGLNDQGFSVKSGLAGVFRGLINTHGGPNIGGFAHEIISALKRQNQDTIQIDQPSNVLSNLSGVREQLIGLLRQQGVTVL